MRTMYDSLYPLNIPLALNPELVAAYVNHLSNPMSYAQAVSRFPNALHVSISVHAGDAANVLDCEAGTHITPSDCPAWVLLSRAEGFTPTVYCPETLWAAVRAAFATTYVAEPLYWVANTDTGPVMIPGAVAHQYTFNLPLNPYDTSVVADYWPGIDPIPTPVEDEDMALMPNVYVGPSGTWTRYPDSVYVGMQTDADIAAVLVGGAVDCRFHPISEGLHQEFVDASPNKGTGNAAIPSVAQVGQSG